MNCCAESNGIWTVLAAALALAATVAAWVWQRGAARVEVELEQAA